MSRRIAKVNKHLQRTFGRILLEEADLPANVLVTVSQVDTTHNLKSATVWLYIYPDSHAEATLKHLESQLYELQGLLNRALDFRPLPRVRLRIDYGAKHAQDIARLADQLKRDDRPAGKPSLDR